MAGQSENSISGSASDWPEPESKAKAKATATATAKDLEALETTAAGLSCGRCQY